MIKETLLAMILSTGILIPTAQADAATISSSSDEVAFFGLRGGWGGCGSSGGCGNRGYGWGSWGNSWRNSYAPSSYSSCASSCSSCSGGCY